MYWIIQSILIGYVIGSPFLFFWFHKNILHENWDNDFTDKVTITLYLVSNIGAQWMSFVFQEMGKK